MTKSLTDTEINLAVLNYRLRSEVLPPRVN